MAYLLKTKGHIGRTALMTPLLRRGKSHVASHPGLASPARQGFDGLPIPCPGHAVPLYRLLAALILPILFLRLALRVLRGSEPRAALCERLGQVRAAQGAIWLHAASNGELVSARPLIEALFDARPGLRLHITTNTVTARALAREWAADWGAGRISASAAPLDSRIVLDRFLDRLRPAALLSVENELWPNRFEICRARGIPVIVVGARMSARSARRWRKAGIGARLMGAVTALSAQDPTSEAAFRDLGLPADRLLPLVNLKTAVAMPAATETLPWPRESTVLAASTHEGEEEIVLDAFAQAHAANPALHLILAPRHPRRAAEIARMIAARDLPFATRSKGEPPLAPVLLADTMGEMANWYAAAGICFVGGSLVPKGGHTPFEPAAHGCAILHGPSIDNHRAAFEALDAAGGAIRVTDAETLARGFALPAAEQARIAATAARVTAELADGSGNQTLARLILDRLTA
ncbi:3-deoxy-D-manno-octulosonic acid transferase [Sinirhodobacter populi]|nr:3-deoxy-D-manno-octulosonic acid transferase [Sinirhodobacter populi]